MFYRFILFCGGLSDCARLPGISRARVLHLFLVHSPAISDQCVRLPGGVFNVPPICIFRALIFALNCILYIVYLYQAYQAVFQPDTQIEREKNIYETLVYCARLKGSTGKRKVSASGRTMRTFAFDVTTGWLRRVFLWAGKPLSSRTCHVRFDWTSGESGPSSSFAQFHVSIARGVTMCRRYRLQRRARCYADTQRKRKEISEVAFLFASPAVFIIRHRYIHPA